MSGALLILLLMLCAAIWMVLDVRDFRRLKIFGLTWAVALYSIVSGIVLHLEDILFPVKFDGWLYRIDASLGLSSFPLANALRLWTGPALGYAYMAMLPAMLLWYATGLHRNWKGPSIVRAYAIEMVLGPVLYMLVPACGPHYAFAGFPSLSPQSFTGTMALQGYPNAIPSLHISTALLLFLFSRGRFWKSVSFVFFVATALATLATGEHYVIDLIVGLPFACLVHAAAHRKFGGSALWAAVIILWLLAIRIGAEGLVDHSIALRTAVILTIVAVVWYYQFQSALLVPDCSARVVAEQEIQPTPQRLERVTY